MWIPVFDDWRMNERHYGALQHENKKALAEKFGEDQLKIWRRSYDVRPPALEDGDARLSDKDPRYSGVPVPRAESLADVVPRVSQFYEKEIVPQLKAGKRILIAGSGNSLRALVKYLDDMAPEQVMELNIPTGIPLVYELDENLKPVGHRYLATDEELAAALETVKNQGKVGK
jgi:2,3-bisphosphoglycerate-dependent phosphoglycerate mutase